MKVTKYITLFLEAALAVALVFICTSILFGQDKDKGEYKRDKAEYKKSQVKGVLLGQQLTHAAAASIALVSDLKISRPSFDPKSSSHARSGCGIIPRTFRS